MRARLTGKGSRMAAARIAVGDYGLVYVVDGPYAGRLGYYDHDDEVAGRLAVVYFELPLDQDAVLIPHCWLRSPASSPAALAHWRATSPAMAAYWGMVWG